MDMRLSTNALGLGKTNERHQKQIVNWFWEYERRVRFNYTNVTKIKKSLQISIWYLSNSILNFKLYILIDLQHLCYLWRSASFLHWKEHYIQAYLPLILHCAMHTPTLSQCSPSGGLANGYMCLICLREGFQKKNPEKLCPFAKPGGQGSIKC